MTETLNEFQNPEMKYLPEVRWWLAEGFHTDQTLKKDIEMIADSGFGGIEFLAMDEECDSSLYGWGAEEWVHDSNIVMEAATKKNLGISFTAGTNWACVNLTTIQPDDKAASKELDFISKRYQAGDKVAGKLLQPDFEENNTFDQTLVGVYAAKIVDENEDYKTIDRNNTYLLNEYIEKTDKGYLIDYQVPSDGEYEIISLWMHGTAQIAKPSNGVAYAVNYLDNYGIKAFKKYWDEAVLTDELKSNIEENGKVQMYMDSIELYTQGQGGQIWGYHILEEFKKRRGYDPLIDLFFVVKKHKFFNQNMKGHEYYYQPTEADKRYIERMRNDLYQTTTELYIENMIIPMKEWLHERDMTLRSEVSYGMPFELSQPIKYVDTIETESLEFGSQADSFRSFSGAAHLFKKQFSSETGATRKNYMLDMDFYNQVIYTQFAFGITRTVLHGYSSICGTEKATRWPGHEGMYPQYSERFGSRQPNYEFYPDWTKMISRYQYALSQGAPRVDLAILRLDYDLNNVIQNTASEDYDRADEEEFYAKGLMREDRNLYWQDLGLQTNGYTYEYIAPQLLEDEIICVEDAQLNPKEVGYQAVIGYQEQFPTSSLRKMITLAKKGLPIVIVNNVNEWLRPFTSYQHTKALQCSSFNDIADEEYSSLVRELKNYDNVHEIETQAELVELLKTLEISPRLSFKDEKNRLLTNLLKDNKGYTAFVYNFKYAEEETVKTELKVAGNYFVYRLNCWTGEWYKVDEQHKNNETLVEISLEPGEAHLLRFETEERKEISLDPTTEKVESKLTLTDWDVTIDSWTEGDKKTIVEDRGLGYTTDEVYYETKVTPIHVHLKTLIPWKDIPEVGESISGVGSYRTTFTCMKKNERIFLKLGSVNGNLCSVFVNGVKGRTVDPRNPIVDISELVKKGENHLEIRVGSTLNNQLLANGYYNCHLSFTGMRNNMELYLCEDTFVRSYGLTGEVELYTQ